MVVVVSAVAEIIVVVEEIEAVPEEARRQTPPLKLRTPAPDLRGPSTLTFQKGSGGGARCISAGVDLHIFVQSQVHVRGRIFSPPSLQEIKIKIRINEVSTSSAKKVKVITLTNCYMIKIYRKYIL